jgi:hypothetical protein
MSNPIKICNKALLQIGAEPIESFEDLTLESEYCDLFYDDLVVELMTLRKWTFCNVMEPLLKLNKVSSFGYSNVYKIPSDSIHIYNSERGGKYRVANGEIHSNDSNMVMEYTVRKSENEWPVYFRNIVQYRLAAELCPAITGNSQRTQELSQKAKQAINIGVSLDGQQQTNPAIRSYAFLSRRG